MEEFEQFSQKTSEERRERDQNHNQNRKPRDGAEDCETGGLMIAEESQETSTSSDVMKGHMENCRGKSGLY